MATSTTSSGAAQAIAERLLAYRTQHSLTRQQLAERMGVHPARVSRIERAVDSPSLDTIARVAALLGEEITVSVRPDGAARAHIRKKVRGRAMEFREADTRVTMVAG